MAFSILSNMKRHIDVVHIGAMKYCTWPNCDFKTASACSLTYHRVKCHEPHKLHKCHLCDYSSPLLWQVTRHRRLRHPEEWRKREEEINLDNPFKCWKEG